MAIGKDVILLKSALKKKLRLRPDLQNFKEQDMTKSFCTGSLHICSTASLHDLKKRVEAKYPDGLENWYFGTDQFKPSFLIDLDTPYAEDRHKELRIGPLLFH